MMKALHITGAKNSMIQLVVSWATADLYLFAGRTDGRSGVKIDVKIYGRSEKTNVDEKSVTEMDMMWIGR